MIHPKQDQLDQIAPWLHVCLWANRSSECLLLGSVFPTNAICLCSTSSIPSEWWTGEPFVCMSKVKSIQAEMWLELRSTNAQWGWQIHRHFLLSIWPLITLTQPKLKPMQRKSLLQKGKIINSQRRGFFRRSQSRIILHGLHDGVCNETQTFI